MSQKVIGKYIGVHALSAILVIISISCAYQRNAVWLDSILLWKDAARKAPMKGRPYHRLGDAYVKRKDFGYAVVYYRKVREVDPNYFKQGVSYARSRSGTDAGFTHGRSNGQGDAGSPLNVIYSAEEYMEQERWDDAISAYQRVLEMNPHQPTILNGLGIAYFRKGLYPEAARLFSQSVEADATYAPSRSNLGFVFFRLGQRDDAVRELREAVTLDPADAEPHAKLGMVYLEAGFGADALGEFQAALKLDPQNRTALKYYNRALPSADELKKR